MNEDNNVPLVDTVTDWERVKESEWEEEKERGKVWNLILHVRFTRDLEIWRDYGNYEIVRCKLKILFSFPFFLVLL